MVSILQRCPLRESRHFYVVVIRTQLAPFDTGVTRLFQGDCSLGVQNRISQEVAMLCNKSEAHSLDTAWERLLQTS